MKKVLLFLFVALTAIGCFKEQEQESEESEELITLEQSHLSFPPEGGTAALKFYSKSAWNAGHSDINASKWCFLVPDSGDPGENEIIITVTPNDTPEARKTEIFIQSSYYKETEYISIEQEMLEGHINIKETSYIFPAEGGVATLIFSSNLGWSIQNESADGSWCSFNKSSGEAGDSEVEITASPNTGPESRSTKLILMNENRSAVEYITIEQYNESDILEANFFEVATSPKGESIIINVKADCEWVASSSEEWCTAESTTDGRQLRIITDCNNSGTRRSATVTISTPLNSRQHSITVSQNPVSSNENPGWVSQNFAHNTLGMTFTASWCGYCPAMSEAMKLSKSRNGNIELMNIHAPGSELEYQDYHIFSNQYFINGTPTGIIDGRIMIKNTNDVEALAEAITEAAYDTEKRFVTQSAISFRPELNGNLLNIEVLLRIKNPGPYKLAMYLLQDNINANQTNYYTGVNQNIVHDNILIKSISEHLGDPFTINSDSETSFSYMTVIPEDMPVNNLRILAVVFTEFPNGDRSSSENFGNYYVDNCLSGAVNITSSTEIGGNEVLTPGDIIK